MNHDEPRTALYVRLTVAAVCVLVAKVCLLLFFAGVAALCGAWGPVNPVFASLFTAMLFWGVAASLLCARHCLTPARSTTEIVDWALAKFATAILVALSAFALAAAWRG